MTSTATDCPDPDQVIARRSTADGKSVLLWASGWLTWALGYAIRGGAQPRTAAQQSLAVRAGWLVMGEVEIYDADEVSALVVAARWAAARGLGPGEMRARLHEDPPLRPVWRVLEADRDGKPRLRVWVLPRLRWPGLAVWDGAHADTQGRYSIMAELGVGSGTYEPTGVRCRNLREVADYLRGCR